MLTEINSSAPVVQNFCMEPTCVLITGAKVASGLPNQSAAVAKALLARGAAVVLHCLTEETSDHFRGQPGVQGTFQSPTIDRPTLSSLCAALKEVEQAGGVKRIGVLLYESFTGYLPPERQSPFLLMEEEDFEQPYVAQMISNRLLLVQRTKALLRHLAQMEYLDPTVVFISSLAAHRAAGQLSLDLIHKALGSALFESACIELSHQLPNFLPTYVEILPGIVDGIYGNPGVKERLLQRSHSRFPAFADGYGPENFPTVHPDVVGEIAALYFTSDEPDEVLPESYREYLLAGRPSLAALEAEFRQSVCITDETLELKYDSLPQYVLAKGVMFGRLPSLKPQQLVRVPITPPGQLF